MAKRAQLGVIGALWLGALSGCGDDAGTGADLGTSAGDALDLWEVPDLAAGQDTSPTDRSSEQDAGAQDTATEDVGRLASGVELISLGLVALDSTGVSELLGFEIPAGVESFTVVIRGVEAATYLVRRLDGPSGVLISDEPVQLTPIEQFTLGPFPSQFKSPNRVVADEGIFAALIPNNPAVNTSSGAYTMRVQGARVSNNMLIPEAASVEVGVYYRSGAKAAGIIDLSLYFTGAGQLNVSSQLVVDALARLRQIYAQANIEIGNVHSYDIDPSFQVIDTLMGAGSDLNEMFKQSAGRGPGLHYFLVDRIQGPLPGAIGGVAGGLPGPPESRGSIAAGVAVAVSAAQNDPGTLAHVMGHEGGHWLGLFHTVEIFGGTEDQMPDTPSGQASNTHLMYPAIGGGQAISPGQAAVMRNHLEVVPR